MGAKAVYFHSASTYQQQFQGMRCSDRPHAAVHSSRGPGSGRAQFPSIIVNIRLSWLIVRTDPPESAT